MLQDPIMFFRIKILCFIYYQQVAGSHLVFQKKHMIFYILSTKMRLGQIVSWKGIEIIILGNPTLPDLAYNV